MATFPANKHNTPVKSEFLSFVLQMPSEWTMREARSMLRLQLNYQHDTDRNYVLLTSLSEIEEGVDNIKTDRYADVSSLPDRIQQALAVVALLPIGGALEAGVGARVSENVYWLDIEESHK